MNPHEIDLVTASAQRLAPVLPDVAHTFYSRLFALYPDLRDAFPAQMEAQEKKFGDSVAAIVAAIPDFPAFAETSERLARVHVAHRVTASQYAALGPVLVDALAAHDPAWDAATRDAWAQAYDLLAESMQLSARP
ncbi:MAG: hypothetical protein LCI03_09865 [Actinobacteria bacterium]|jgi:hemoglobin-like flavoprotein|nr:hypothetical protein [Actinomycetota bacterium]